MESSASSERPRRSCARAPTAVRVFPCLQTRPPRVRWPAGAGTSAVAAGCGIAGEASSACSNGDGLCGAGAVVVGEGEALCRRKRASSRSGARARRLGARRSSLRSRPSTQGFGSSGRGDRVLGGRGSSLRGGGIESWGWGDRVCLSRGATFGARGEIPRIQARALGAPGERPAAEDERRRAASC